MFNFPSRTSTPIAIKNVTVIPMDTERLLHGQTVIIEDGWIKSMGSMGNFDTSGMTEVDGTGKYLLPGLTDMHVHYWMPGDSALFLAHGVTFVRNMSGAPFHLALQRKIEQGEVPGPRIVTTSPIIDADKFMLPMWKALRDPSNTRELVKSYAERGYQQIKILNSINRETLRALGSICREMGMRLTGHCPLDVTYEEAIHLGMTSFEHCVGIWRGHFQSGVSPEGTTNLSLDVVEAVAEHLDYDSIRRLAGQMAKEEIWNCPTLITDQLMQLPFAEGMENTNVKPYLKYAPQFVLPLWEVLDSNRRYAKDPAMLKRWRKAIDGRAQALSRVTRILYEEGAPLLIGTDTSVRFVIQGVSVHQELENFVSAGIPPFDAIHAGTSEPARFLGRQDEFGTVAEGKRADLILVDQNPLEEISALMRPVGVFTNGYYLSRENLDLLLNKQAEIASRPSIEILPTNTLEDNADNGQLIQQGSWTEYSDETVIGKLAYRHVRLLNGGWQINEKYAFEQNSIFDIGGGKLRSTSLTLNPNFTIQAGSIIEESFAGTSQLIFTTTDGKTIQVKQTGEDNFTNEYEIAGEELLTDISLSLSLPALVSNRKALEISNEYQVICFLPSIEFERMKTGKAVIEMISSPEDDKMEWAVKSQCQETSNTGTYVFENEGFRNCEYLWNRFVPD